MISYPHLHPPVAEHALARGLEIDGDEFHALDCLENDPDFLDFMESISLGEEEMTEFISNPDLSIADIRRRSLP